MNFKKIDTQKLCKRALGMVVITVIVFMAGCDTDDPIKEDVPELITKATLTFSAAGQQPIEVTATDPDGEGVQDLKVDGPINLQANKSYTMEITLVNGLVEPSDPAFNITDEVADEADEHLFFFSWTNNLYNDPTGNGNIDNKSDDINYEDEDLNGLPLGLKTFWTTAGPSSGSFRVVLKHQPDLKSSTSDSNTGETDLDITFTINVQE
jgi:hypothetical protein